jgi:hypothetical protein
MKNATVVNLFAIKLPITDKNAKPATKYNT